MSAEARDLLSLNIALSTPLPGFANEYCDVLKLFFVIRRFTVNAEAVEPGFEALTQRYIEADGEARCTFTFRGRQSERVLVFPPDTAPEHHDVVHKRLTKRLCKLTLYDLLKELTGKRPPWGSLTGIRPTRLLYERLGEGMTLQQGVCDMERTFDVTHEKAELLGRIITVQQTLPQPRQDEIDVYVSIPFCRTRCAYCSFPGEAIGKGGQVRPYLDALEGELTRGAKLIKDTGCKLRALYIGGGTPTALSEDDFKRLLKTVMLLFPGAYETTVEAGRPDTITRGKLEAMRALNISRVSINPQTMNDPTLRAIGRDHTAAQTLEAYALAREAGFQNINMDVIAGLPGEGAKDFAHTMRHIERLKPDSLTVHTLAIKRSSRLNLEHFPLPNAETAAEMVRLGEETAAAIGCQPYYLYRQKYMAGQQQNVGYARPGSACLYNVDIMEECTSILAFGAGAISKRVFPDRELRIERAPNVSNVSVYIERMNDMFQRKSSLFSDGNGG